MPSVNGFGRVELRCARRGGRDAVDVLRSEGLARANPPLRAGGAPHVVLATLGPGLIGGDRFVLDVALDAGAALSVGGQMATPVFGGRGAVELDTGLRVAARATACLVAEPLVVAGDARVLAHTRLAVAAGGVAVLAETLLLAPDAALHTVVEATYAGARVLRDAAAVAAPNRREPAVATVYRIGERGRAAARADGWALVEAAPGLRGGVGETTAALIARLVGDPDAIRRGADALARTWFGAALRDERREATAERAAPTHALRPAPHPAARRW